MQKTDSQMQMNHGGHEMLDVKDAIGCSIDTMNQYMVLRSNVKNQELQGIMDRQHQFMLDEYNKVVESFQSGQDPSQPTGTYNMETGNDFVYGLKPVTMPQKPMENVNEISEEWISSRLLGALKAGAKTLTAASLESTNPVVRRVLADSVPNWVEMAYEISIFQNKNGFYQVPQFNEADMKQMLNSFSTTKK